MDILDKIRQMPDDTRVSFMFPGGEDIVTIKALREAVASSRPSRYEKYYIDLVKPVRQFLCELDQEFDPEDDDDVVKAMRAASSLKVVCLADIP